MENHVSINSDSSFEGLTNEIDEFFEEIDNDVSMLN